ncbi:hypothetical protein Ahy_A02g008510 [Arachis hypogaea]|uniref:Uncharacterized protein n=1 Tax=Arachis hypogaea TaxID=3818 RepID=A0A445EF45_ARAHY|nr:hypothetical protein Ahy_A02g008510 [Arachis hypogaea]
MKPLLPFPLVMKDDDAISPNLNENDISFCSLCNFELIIKGGTAIAVFIRCFADKRGMVKELHRKLHVEFPREVLATIWVQN